MGTEEEVKVMGALTKYLAKLGGQLGPGWRCQVRKRAGPGNRVDTYFHSPAGEKFRYAVPCMLSFLLSAVVWVSFRVWSFPLSRSFLAEPSCEAKYCLLNMLPGRASFQHLCF